MDQNMVHLSSFMCTYEICVSLCCWVECYVNIKYVTLIDSEVKVFHIFTDFLPTCSIRHTLYCICHLVFLFICISLCFMYFEALFLTAVTFKTYLFLILIFKLESTIFYISFKYTA